jgi:hypothetical protein
LFAEQKATINQQKERKIMAGIWVTVICTIVGLIATIATSSVSQSGSGYTSQADACLQTWNGVNSTISSSGMSATAKNRAYQNAENAYYCCEQGLFYDPKSQNCISG